MFKVIFIDRSNRYRQMKIDNRILHSSRRQNKSIRQNRSKKKKCFWTQMFFSFDFSSHSDLKFRIDRLSSRCSSTTMNNERNVQEEIRSRKGNEWTVKSTMITYHRQGLTSSTESPSISKSVCQTVASIENLSSTSPRSTSTSFVTAKGEIRCWWSKIDFQFLFR